MSRPEVFRMGIVGCGGIAHSHARAARRLPHLVEFVACCDIRADAAADWAAQYGCRTHYTEYEEMVRQEELDGVVVATWPVHHREHVEGCLRAGIGNILCEKALTLTGAEAMKIWERVDEARAFLMEGFMYRHHPAIRRAEDRVASGELGPVDNVRACFSTPDAESVSADDPNRDWRQRKECGGGIPYDFACYCVNACQHFTGGIPVSAHCRGGVSEKYGTINRMYGLIEYHNGCVGLIESSRKSSHTQELQITGGARILRLPLAWTIFEDATLIERHSDPWPCPQVDTYPIEKVDPYQLQLENFVAAARNQAAPIMPLAESVVNTCTIEALVKSLESGGTVAVEVPEVIRHCLEAGGRG